jgi:hypothetical protein
MVATLDPELKDVAVSLYRQLHDEKAAQVLIPNFIRIAQLVYSPSIDLELSVIRDQYGNLIAFEVPPSVRDAARRRIFESGPLPVMSAETFAVDFWPEDRGAEELVEQIDRWRREGGDA